MNKKEILKKVTAYYLNSDDFNGLSLNKLQHFSISDLCELIKENLIEVLSEKEVSNPHIKAFNLNIPVKDQIENISDPAIQAVLYPTEKSLKTISTNHNRFFSKMLEKGQEKLKIVFFNIEILERYSNNPQYIIFDNGYSGAIYLKDEHYHDEEENDEYEYIKSYAMGYKNTEKLERCIGIFLGDLAKLPEKAQMMWKYFELPHQENYRVHSDFIQNTIRGEWSEYYWIFNALLEEIKIINQQCICIGIPEMFKKTYGKHTTEKPEGYRNLFLPTLNNYYEFVSTLEKMFIHNISHKTFTTKAPFAISVDRKDKEERDKGTLVLLNEWLNANCKTEMNISEKIIKPLKKIRKIRQTPAHKIYNNGFNIDLYEEQNRLIDELYRAIRGLRLIFMLHPKTKDVKIPDWLYTGEKIVCY